MKTTYLLLTFVFVTTTAYGQSDFDGVASPSERNRGPVPLLPADYGHWHHHCSTAYEGWLRSRAALLHARGNYLVNQFQAAMLAEQARGLDLSNDGQLILLHDWKKDRRSSRLAANRWKNLAKQPAKYQAAYQLSPNQLDPVTGKIIWPATLQSADYDGYRQRLETLFDRKYGDNDWSSEIVMSIATVSESLSRDLGRNRQGIAVADYLAAQKFLRGLEYEPMFRSQLN